jgi:hypothetical protein
MQVKHGVSKTNNVFHKVKHVALLQLLGVHTQRIVKHYVALLESILAYQKIFA